MVIVEACVNSVTSAIEAEKEGAHRVELCDNRCYDVIEYSLQVLQTKLRMDLRWSGDWYNLLTEE